MYQKTLSLFLALVALICIGYGTTGFYVMDYSFPVCTTDVDCETGVCCDVGDHGLCAEQSECAGLENAVSDSVSQISSWDDDEFDDSLRDTAWDDYSNNAVAIVLGGIILLIIIMVAIVEYDVERKAKKRRLRKKVVKKKVKRKAFKKKVVKKKRKKAKK